MSFEDEFRAGRNWFRDAIERSRDAIAKILSGHEVEVAAVEHAAAEVAEAGFVAAEPALEAIAETAVHAAVQSGAAVIESEVPVLAPAIEAGAVATEKAADGAMTQAIDSAAQKASSNGQAKSQ